MVRLLVAIRSTEQFGTQLRRHRGQLSLAVLPWIGAIIAMSSGSYCWVIHDTGDAH